MKLTSAQQSASRAVGKRVLVYAPAGGGKTAIIVDRVSYLKKKRDPLNVAIITYTNSAVGELVERLGDDMLYVGFCGTLHAFLLRILQSRGPKFTVASDVVSEALLMECAEELRMSKQAVRVAREGMRQVDPQCPPHVNTSVDLLVSRYQQKLADSQMVDYDGILWMGERTLYQYSGFGYSDVIVDEAQDLSDQDFRILEELYEHGANLFLVADPMQSIFSFRGSSPHALEQFDANVVSLKENFRSLSAVVQVANHLDQVRHALCVLEDEGKGSAIVRQFNLLGDEREYVIKYLHELRYESAAILLRTNRLVDSWKQSLLAAGIPLVSPWTPILPREWDMAMLGLNFLAAPNNDVICKMLLKAKCGEEHLGHAQGRAIMWRISLNEASFNQPEGMDVAGALKFIETLGVSPVCLEFIQGAINAAMPFQSLGELLLKLRSLVTEARPIGQGVYIGTIHSAKGREWDSVILPHFVEGVLPITKGDVNEEQRVAYTAVTRARVNLLATYHLYDEEWPQQRKPSRFLGAFKEQP